MNRCAAFLLFVMVLRYPSNAQPQCSSFTLEGTINTDTGNMILMPITDNSYYFNSKGSQESKIINGKFIFNDSIAYPCLFRLGLKVNSNWKYLSDAFFIDPCFQTIICNVDSLREIPEVINESMKELRGNYNDLFNQLKFRYDNINKKEDRLYNLYKDRIPDSLSFLLLTVRNKLDSMKDTIFLSYIKKHSNSFVALWELIKGLSEGYKPFFDSAYTELSNSIRNTKAGIVLAKKLRAAKAVAAGSKFPKLRLLNINMKEVTAPEFNNSSKFTLVDFWFSHCMPCISQFEELKKIFSQNTKKGFNIVAISVDNKDYINDWKSIIKKYHLPWKQYLDIGSKEAVALSVEKFPTNFLVDKQGKIIAKDIQLFNLESFLAKNLF